jgi:hypothetical protein
MTFAKFVSIGSDLANYDVEPSRCALAEPALASISNFSLSISKIVGGSVSLTRGKKDTAAGLKSGDYDDQVSAASEWNTLMYDAFSKRAWLIDGATALLHISRTWLSIRARRNAKAKCRGGGQEENRGFQPDDFSTFRCHGSFDGKESSMDTLCDYNNRLLRVSAEPKVEIVGQSGRTVSTKEPTWTVRLWENVVEDKYAALEAIHDLLIKCRLNPSTDIKRPFGDNTFEAYDFRDLVTGNSSLQPRVIKMLPTAGMWPKWALQSGMIPLVGRDFGEIIKPSSNPDAAPRCTSTLLCPAGRDYLATPVALLAEMNGSATKRKRGCLGLGKSFFWNNPVASVQECGCSDGNCSLKIAKIVGG